MQRSKLPIEIVLLLSRVNPISSNKFAFAALLKIRFDVHFLKRDVDERARKKGKIVSIGSDRRSVGLFFRRAY